jgi:hypothetical protein
MLISFLEVYILKILKSVMTLAATVAMRRNGIVKTKGETTHFQMLVFPGKKFPSIMAGTKFEHKF